MSAVTPFFPVGNFVPVAYRGNLTAAPCDLGSTGGLNKALPNGGTQVLNAGHQSYAVQTNYEWEIGSPNLYTGQSVNINFNVNNGGQGVLLDKILMVFINNISNISDITVYFPDTGQFVTCQGGTSGYFPCMTNLTSCYVFNGLTGKSIGLGVSETSQILFCNFAIPAFQTQKQSNTNEIFSGLFPVTADLVLRPFANLTNLKGTLAYAEFTLHATSATQVLLLSMVCSPGGQGFVNMEGLSGAQSRVELTGSPLILTNSIDGFFYQAGAGALTTFDVAYNVYISSTA